MGSPEVVVTSARNRKIIDNWGKWTVVGDQWCRKQNKKREFTLMLKLRERLY